MLIDKAVGCLMGLAVGDVLGTTVEFKHRGTFEPVRDMVAGAYYGIKNIPEKWINKIKHKDKIIDYTKKIWTFQK